MTVYLFVCLLFPFDNTKIRQHHGPNIIKSFTEKIQQAKRQDTIKILHSQKYIYLIDL